MVIGKTGKNWLLVVRLGQRLITSAINMPFSAARHLRTIMAALGTTITPFYEPALLFNSFIIKKL